MGQENFKFMFDPVDKKPSNNQQLRKSNVLSYHDPGNLVISYKKFSDLVPYHFILTEVFRQKEGMP